MDIKINIRFNLEQPITISSIANCLQINFSSFETYQDYLINPHPLELLEEWEKEFLTKKELQKIEKLQNKLNSNLKHLTNLMKLSTLEVFLNNQYFMIKDVPLQRMRVDLRQLSPENVIKSLNLPWPKSTLFLDTFNPYHQTTKEELLKAYNKINDRIKLMKAKNPTPAEVAFYAFDEARKRLYIANDTEKDLALSRDLSYVLEDDKIVCAGFSQIFCAICSFFNIPTDIIYWHNLNSKLTGHASCLVYLNDDKYNIHGLYEFDPTANRKLDEQDTDYIHKCSKAFIPIHIKIKAMTKYELKEAGIFFQTVNRLKTLERMLNLGQSPILMIENQIRMVVDSLNRIYNLIGLPLLDTTSSFTYYELEKKILNLGNQQIVIPIETFQNLATQARILEHDINPDYPIDQDSLNKLIASSFSNEYSNAKKQGIQKLLRFLEE